MVNCLRGLSYYFNLITSFIGKVNKLLLENLSVSVIAVLLTRKNDAT